MLQLYYRVMRAFRNDEAGLTIVEYGVLAAFIVLLLAATAYAFGPQLQTWLEDALSGIMRGG